MSAYYLKQVVKDWSLGTIYKGMAEFMIIQCIAIALLIIFPQIALYLPEMLQAEARAVKVEQVDDSLTESLEKDPLMDSQEKSESDAEEAEKGEKKAGDLEEDEASKAKK
jgi:hypothetical protein